MTSQTLRELDALVADGMATLADLIEVRLVPLLVRRRIAAMAGLDPAGAPAGKERSETPDPVPAGIVKVPKRLGRPPGSKDRRKGAVTARNRGMRLPRGMSAHVILKALSTAPAEGMHGRDLNALIIGAGLTIDTAEKSKTYLRHWGLLDHDVITGLWSFKPEVRSAYPDLSALVPKPQADSVKSRRDIREHGVGRLVMEVLAAGSPHGTPSLAVYDAVQAAGYSYSSVKKALNGLRIAGHVVAGDHRGEATWRIVPQAGSPNDDTPMETAR